MVWLKFFVGLLLVVECYEASIDLDGCYITCSQEIIDSGHSLISHQKYLNLCFMSDQVHIVNGTYRYEKYPKVKRCLNLTLDTLKNGIILSLNQLTDASHPNITVPIFEENNVVSLSLGISYIDINFMNDVEIKHLSRFTIIQEEKLRELKPYTFNGSSIEHLVMSDNALASINEAFMGSKNVQDLKLASNQLEKITNISLMGLFDLRTLDLKHNKIAMIDLDSFIHLPNLEILRLDFNVLTQIDNSIFWSNQKLSVLYLDNNRLNQVSFDMRNDNLKFLNLSNNDIEHLDKSSFQGLTSLNYLNLRGNPLKHLDSDTFTFSAGLEYIFIECPNNSVTTITERSFSTISYAMQLIVIGCLVELPPNGFSNIYVDYLALNRTQITTLNRTAFSRIRYIGEISISHGKLEFVDSLAFKNFQFTSGIFLDHNKISTIKSWFDLNENYLLEYLDLSYNDIVHIDTNAFQGLRKLQNLLLESNKIKTISGETMREIPLIKYLDLKDNRVKDFMDIGLPVEFGQSLDILDLRGNLLQDIVFAKLLYIGTLLLDNNKIETLNCERFQKLAIESLAVRGNKIKSIQFFCYFFSINLKYLDLSRNSITSITKKQIEGLNLEVFDLSHNKLKDLSFMDTLLTNDVDIGLNLSFNQATFLKANPLLKKAFYVHLKDNPWECGCDDKHSFMNQYLYEYSVITCCPNNCTCGPNLNDELIIHCEGVSQSKLPYCNPHYNTVLNYASTSLHSIPNAYDFQHVISLNVSKNNLNSKNFALSSSAINLKMIDLSENEFMVLDESTAKILSDIENVKLNGNPWKCSCDSHHITIMNLLLKKIKHPPCCPSNCSCLNRDSTFVVNCSRVAGAELPSCLPYNKVYLDYSYSGFNKSFDNLKNIDNVEGIDLSNNKIGSLSLEAFHMSKRMQSINLSNNQLRTVSPTTADILNVILRKNLRHNPWTCSCENKDSLLMHILLENDSNPPCCPTQCQCASDASDSFIQCQGIFKPTLPSCIPWKNSHLYFSNTSLSSINFNDTNSLDNVIGINLSHQNQIPSLENLNRNNFPNLRYLNLECNNLKNLSKLKKVKHLQLFLAGNIFDCQSCTEVVEYAHIKNITCDNGAFQSIEFHCFLTNVVAPAMTGTLCFIISLFLISIFVRRSWQKRINPHSSNGVTIRRVKKADMQDHRKLLKCYEKMEQSLDSLPPNVLRRIWSNANGVIIFEKWHCTLREVLKYKTNFDSSNKVIEIGSFCISLKQIFKNILEGLSQLHGINIAHNSVNLDSFFLVQDTEKTLKVKLSSFFKWSDGGRDDAQEREKAEDIYQAGKIMENIMEVLECQDPLWQNLIAAMTHEDWSKRPSCITALTEAPGFYDMEKMIDLICNVNEQLLAETEKMQKSSKDHSKKLEIERLFENLETHATFVFGGRSNWLQPLDSRLCLDFCARGKYKITSVLYLNRLIRNVINHKGNNPESLKKVTGKVNPSREEVFAYFHSIFPTHFIHIFAFWKLTLMKEENLFATLYSDYEKQCHASMDGQLQPQNRIFIMQSDGSRRELTIHSDDPLAPFACLTFPVIKKAISDKMMVDEFALKLSRDGEFSRILTPNVNIMDGSLVEVEKIESINVTVSFKNLPDVVNLPISLKNSAKVSKFINQVFLSMPATLHSKKDEMKIFHIDQLDRKEIDKDKKLSDYKIHDNAHLEIEWVPSDIAET